MEDPGAAARLFKDFAKDNEEFEVKALSVGGQLLSLAVINDFFNSFLESDVFLFLDPIIIYLFLPPA
jgi:hypothetical protein